MGKIKELFLKYKQFLLFCIVGLSNTVIANLIYFLLIKIFESAGISIAVFDFNITSGICTAVGTVFGAINSYILNSKFVFEEKNKYHKEIYRLVCARDFGFCTCCQHIHLPYFQRY